MKYLLLAIIAELLWYGAGVLTMTKYWTISFPLTLVGSVIIGITTKKSR